MYSLQTLRDDGSRRAATLICLLAALTFPLAAQDAPADERWNLFYQATSLASITAVFRPPIPASSACKGTLKLKPPSPPRSSLACASRPTRCCYFDPEMAGGRGLYNDWLELFGNACAAPTNVLTASESTQPASVPTASQSTQPTNVPTAPESTQPDKSDDTSPGLIDYLSKTGHHDVHDETWNLYGQLTTIFFYKPPFHAAYTNLNGSNSSLKPNAEESFTQTLSLFFGLRLRRGTEIYIVPEEISETTLSSLKGLGGATENFELQKVGTLRPTVYHSRLFVRQTFGFGGESIELPSGQMQLGEHVDRRRLVFTLGNFGGLDVFDKNNVIGDLRKSFFDEAFMTYPAWDFPADARGYSVGAAAELYWDQWVVRLMRLMPPVEPNSQTLNFQPFKYYGDQVEFEHDHVLFGGQPGAVRLLLYRNHEFMGRFADAINAFKADPADNAANCGNLYNYGSENANAPDLCFVRKTNVKVGIGVNAEQSITPNIGVFFRAMYSDGRTEVEAYDSADRSASVGAVVKGTLWGRPLDSVGLGIGTSWISAIHAQYLEIGGVDGFIGDGALTKTNENMTEIYYSRHISRSVYVSVDYQRLWNPGYNAARGPVNLFGGKLHVEF